MQELGSKKRIKNTTTDTSSRIGGILGEEWSNFPIEVTWKKCMEAFNTRADGIAGSCRPV
jgi:hypothetical protein